MKKWIQKFNSQKSAFPKLDVFFIGDGVGESIILKVNGEYVSVIDAYGTKKHSKTTELLKILNVKKINHLILTHLHHDHYSGLFNVLESNHTEGFGRPNVHSISDIYKIQHIFDMEELGTKNEEDSPLFALFGKISEKNKREWKDSESYLHLGNRSSIFYKRLENRDGTAIDFKIDCLAPVASITDKLTAHFVKRVGKLHQKGIGGYNFKSDDAQINLTSLVLKIEFGENLIILTGDNENQSFDKIAPQTIFNDKKNLIVKIPHHGSETSDSKVFFGNDIQQFQNKIGVVTPYNRFSLPKREVIEKYLESGYTVCQTSIMKPDLPENTIGRSSPKGIVRLCLTGEGDCDISTWGTAAKLC